MASKRKRARQRRVVTTAPASRPAQKLPVEPRLRRPQPKPRSAREARQPRPARVTITELPAGRLPLVAAGAVALIAFVLYCLTVEHTVAPGDSGELTADAYTVGIAHPPGYPLYTMLGAIVTHLPGGSAALRLNLFSGLLDAITVALVFLIAYRLIVSTVVAAARWLPVAAAASGALLLAFSVDFWGYSVVAEVFALDNLLAAAALLLALEWARRPRPAVLWGLLFVFGLGLCNQLTIVLFLPALAILVGRGWLLLPATREHPIRVRLRDIGVAAGAFVAGLLPLLYLPLAGSTHPSMAWADPTTWSGFKDLVERKDYGTRTLILGGKHGSIGHNLWLLMANLTTGFVFVGLVLALLGLWWAARRRPVEGTALVTAFLFAGPIFQVYTNTGYPDELTKGVVARFYILPSIPMAILAGIGAFFVLERAAALRLFRPAFAVAVAGAAVVGAPVAAAAVNFSGADQSGVHVAQDYGVDLLSSLPRNALLLTRGDENFGPVVYLQKVEHYRTDVIALDTELLKKPSYVALIRREHPDVLIPFVAYDGGVHTSLNTLVGDNLPHRPVFYVGDIGPEQKDFGRPFDHVLDGLDTQLLPKGTAPAGYNADAYTKLHVPAHAYPESSWETAIAQDYAQALNNAGVAMQTAKDTAHLQLNEQLYRDAIRLQGHALPVAYKNLGSILLANGGDAKEAIAAFQTYLALRPNDPQDPKIREAIAELRARP